MAKALGIGGIFFKAEEPSALTEWYRKWLHFPEGDDDYVPFSPVSVPKGEFTIWSPFSKDSEYFGNPIQNFTINIMVDDLDGALKQVAEGGAEVLPKTESYDYGRFGWFIDPAGNRIEFWQPMWDPSLDIEE
ncbi:MAG: VOC family protein [Verrucomicrobia bacterium]|nr:VOC family protein [Verrucomicrobiota bacterium]MDA1068142.1 VOC family protein [Verrucomicrobiota bacterium]